MLARQLFRSGLQSGTIMSVADVCTQLGVEGKSTDEYNPHRTLRWTVAGLTMHGPYFYMGFALLDRQFGAATSFRTVAAKTITGQVFLFPPYLIALFTFMGLAEGHPDILGKLRKGVPDAFVNGCVFWPIVNSFNFAFVSPSMRIPYLALLSGVWNSYLSLMNARIEPKMDSVKVAV